MQHIAKSLTFLFCSLLLSACAIQLVPSYDKALVDGLNEANTATLTLFASVEDGKTAASFADFDERYATIIGQFEALRMRATSRPIPPLAGKLVHSPVFQVVCPSRNDIECINASPTSIEQIVTGLRRMRDTHRSQGLAPDIVRNFRSNYDVAIGQALAVESALQR